MDLNSGGFYRSCGSRLTVPYTQARPGFRIRAKRVVYVVVLVMVIVLATAASVYIIFGPNTPMTIPSTPRPFVFTYLFLSIFYENNLTATTGYFGSAYQPLNNGQLIALPYTGSFTLYLKPTETSHSVDMINIVFNPGYWVRSASPSPPFAIAPGTSKTITVTIPLGPAIPFGNATITVYTH